MRAQPETTRRQKLPRITIQSLSFTCYQMSSKTPKRLQNTFLAGIRVTFPQLCPLVSCFKCGWCPHNDISSNQRATIVKKECRTLHNRFSPTCNGERPELAISATSSMRKTRSASFGALLHCFSEIELDAGEGWRQSSTGSHKLGSFELLEGGQRRQNKERWLCATSGWMIRSTCGLVPTSTI